MRIAIEAERIDIMNAMGNRRNNYYEFSDRVYSYQTCIRQTVAGGLTLGNVTYYGCTTSKHQGKANVRACDVLLDNVPDGTSDLLVLAVQRGLVYPIDKIGQYAVRMVYSA